MEVMSADELLGFSNEQQEPIEIELMPGKTIKVKPLDLVANLRVSGKANTGTPEGMADYIAEMIASTIIEPELTDEQREQLKNQICRWPSTVVARITDEYYKKMGITGTALEQAVASAESFLVEGQ